LSVNEIIVANLWMGNKVGVFAYAKDFSASLRYARNDEVGWDIYKRNPQSASADSPFVKGA
jgi:hypothetical protein